jgi:hypothetical protein
LLQFDKLDLFKERIAVIQGGPRAGPSQAEHSRGWVVLGLITVGHRGRVYLMLTRPAIHARVMEILSGLGEGIRSVTRTRNTLGFHLPHLPDLVPVCAHVRRRLLLPTRNEHGFWAGIMAGFVAGAIGIVLVQGGIGVYPAFVALIVSIYMPAPEGGGLLRPEAFAMGWLIWVAQTVMTIVLGGLSLLLISRTPKPSET